MAKPEEARARELYQKIRDLFTLEGLDFIPESVVDFYVTNLFGRTFSYLIGWFGTTPTRVQTTSAGILKTAPGAAGFEYNDTYTGTATDTWSAAIAFTQTASRVDIFIWDNPADIQRSSDGIVWQDTIEVPANTMYSFDAVTVQFRIKNTNAGFAARYQVIGWW